MKNYLIKTISIMLVILCNSPLLGITSKVVLTDGGTPALRETVAERLTTIVNSLEEQAWDRVKDYCTPSGLSSLRDLVQKTSCRNVNPLYETKLLDLPAGGFEVREIKVKVDMKKTRGNPFQYMVFTLTHRGLLEDVRFAMEYSHYREIIKEGERLNDFAFRQQILQFLEIFRTAYNRKDLDYLRKVYSEDALIIVGRVLREKPGERDYLENASLSRERIQFIKLSKKQYINRLERIFNYNEFVKVNFEEVAINRHPNPKFYEIYGVTLKQNWRTPRYHDEGWLFLMVDFRDRNNPLIHVRSWQPERFPDGSVVSLGDFELIE